MFLTQGNVLLKQSFMVIDILESNNNCLKVIIYFENYHL
jgi:hypothetical protein